jgi:Ran GTPase-activating protein (RanGAP) involved in mRNA processing and transport
MNLSRNTISQYTAEPLSDILSLDTGLAFLDLSFCELSDTVCSACFGGPFHTNFSLFIFHRL